MFLDHIRTLPSWLLNRASARGRELVTEGLAAEGLRMGHHALLAALADLADLAERVETPVTQADLVRLTGFDPKDVVVLLNDLEERGLAAREPHPTDRRKNALRVTGDGRKTLSRLVVVGEAANQRLLAPLSDAEREELVRLLRLVAGGQTSPVSG